MKEAGVASYVVNEAPVYLGMALVSITMLRAVSRLPIRVHLVLDGAADSMPRPNEPAFATVPRDIFEASAASLGVDVVHKPVIRRPDGSAYFYLNKIHHADNPEPATLVMDADTFVFRDLAPLFETYADADLVACPNAWLERTDYPRACLPFIPYNAGVTLMRRPALLSWADRLRSLDEPFSDVMKPLADWEAETFGGNLREEISLSVHAHEQQFAHRAFAVRDCLLRANAHDVLRAPMTAIFHSLTPFWADVYDRYLKRAS